MAVKKMKMLSIPVKQSAKEAMETALEIEATRMGRSADVRSVH